MSSDELAILKKHLELNLNCDDAAFRMQLFASLQSALVRLRDSSLRDLRRKKPSESQGSVAQAIGVYIFLLLLNLCSLNHELLNVGLDEYLY